MNISSRFLFTGSTVLSLLFLVSGHWLLLPIAFFISFFAMIRADKEQMAEMDNAALAMMLEQQHDRPLLSLDYFRGKELLFYRAGSPVYRELIAKDSRWQFIGPDQGEPARKGCIRVFPGYLYQRVKEGNTINSPTGRSAK